MTKEVKHYGIRTASNSWYLIEQSNNEWFLYFSGVKYYILMISPPTENKNNVQFDSFFAIGITNINQFLGKKITFNINKEPKDPLKNGGTTSITVEIKKFK